MSKLACLTRGRDRAFPAHPRVDRYFPAAAIEDARNRLARCIDRGDGPGLVIGPTGSGKTLLLQLLATQFADRFSVACLTSTPLSTRRELLQAILFELRHPYRDREEGELRLALVELLLDSQSCPDGLLLMIDEAHLLPTRLLEELRVLSNLTCAGEPRVRLILAGGLQVDEMFAAPELEVFSQRLAARCYLAPLTHRETVEYTRAQVAAAGAEPDELFVPEALDALYQATDGIPRLVNQVCDRALLLAMDRGMQRIDKAVIEAAWSDLQQLPAPWASSHGPAQTDCPSVIEFGALEDYKETSVESPAETDPRPDAPFSSGPTMRVFHSPAVEELAKEGAVEQDRSSSPDHRPNSPFAEPFAEEEIVLDRFASLEAAFHAKTPRVCNRREASWSQMLSDVEINETNIAADASPPAEREAEPFHATDSDFPREDSFDKCGEPRFSGLTEPFDTCATPVSAPAVEEESEVLCIEDDAPAPELVNRQVERRDYRQLFTSLRGD